MTQKTPSNEAEKFELYQHLVKRAVGRLLSHYFLSGNVVDEEDLFQAGNIALLNAIRNFNPERGVKFETYANIAIINAVREELYRFKGPFSLGKDTARVFRFIAYLVNIGATDKEICGQLEITNNRLGTLKKLVDTGESSAAPETDHIDDGSAEVDIKDIMRSIFEDINLSFDEKKIIKGKMADKSFELIGRDLGCSREKARKMYYGILEKIRGEVDG